MGVGWYGGFWEEVELCIFGLVFGFLEIEYLSGLGFLVLFFRF